MKNNQGEHFNVEAIRKKNSLIMIVEHAKHLLKTLYIKSEVMSKYLVTDTKKITTRKFIEMKKTGEKISMLTAYDFTSATIIDQAGIDGILVGDSAANVMLGANTSLPITLDQMIYHARCVMNGVKRAMVVCDMPFGSYQVNKDEALRNAIRIMKETGVDALKLEGGEEIIETVKALVNAGIPVMGHLGLTPQSVHQLGGYSLQAKKEKELIFHSLDKEAGKPKDITLSSEQKNAIDKITEAKDYHLFYLYGITGSGKTEVFLRSAKKIIEEGNYKPL